MSRVITSIFVLICGLLIVIGIYLPWVGDMTGDQVLTMSSMFGMSVVEIRFAQIAGFIIIFCSLAVLLIAILQPRNNRSMPILSFGIVSLIMSFICAGCIIYNAIHLVKDMEAQIRDIDYGLYMSGIAALIALLSSAFMASSYKLAYVSTQWQRSSAPPQRSYRMKESQTLPRRSGQEKRCDQCFSVLPTNSRMCNECGHVDGQPIPKYEPPSTIKCSKCGSKNTSAAKFCASCGANIHFRENPACHSCGTINSSDAKFCANCGTSLN